MPLLFVGSAMADFNIVTARSTTTFLAPDVSEGILVRGTGEVARSLFKAPAVNLWASFYLRFTSNPVNASCRFVIGEYLSWPGGIKNIVSIYMSTTNMSLRINDVGVASSSIATGGGSTPYRVDVRVRGHGTTGRIEVYLDGVLTMEYDGNTLLGSTSYNGLQISGNGFTNDYTFSAVMVGTADTRLFQMASMPITGNGFFTDWIGDYTQVDEVGIDNLDFILATTPGMKETFTVTKPAIPVGYSVGAIVVNAQVSKYGPDIDAVGAILYDTVNSDVIELGQYAAYDVLYEGQQVIAEANPQTGVKFTPEEYAAVQIGYQTY